MKKEVENKNSFITDLSSSESSSDESEKEIPIENKEEIKKEIEKYLLTDKKPKKTTPNKTKKLKERESSSSNSDDQRKIQTNQSNQKTKEIHPQRFTQENTCERRRFQRTSKKGKKTSLDYCKRKNNKYMVEYNGKKIHFGTRNTEDYIIHKDPDRRDKYLTKAMKITNKDGELTYQFPTYPNYWSIKLLS